VPPSARALAQATVTPIQVTGPSTGRLDLVFVGDGYTADELDLYSEQVADKWAEVSAVEPYRTYKNFFNVWQVDVVSPESGVDNDPTVGVERDTALDMLFWCQGLDRLLCVDEDKASGFAAEAPDADQVIALANSTTYGGAGGGVATSSGGNALAGQIVVHELGHTLGELADEYDAPGGVYTGPEPGEYNVSRLTVAQLARQRHKWFRWLGEISPDGGVVGAYEGAQYHTIGLFRPTKNSIMRTLGREFNLPGREAMIKAFHNDVVLLRTNVNGRTVGRNAVITLEVPSLVGETLDVRWYAGHREIRSLRGDTIVSVRKLGRRENSMLTVRVTDTTKFVRDERFRANHMTASQTWRIIRCGGKSPATRCWSAPHAGQ
jgi:hypothetical protein